jgi:hypothetical protein
MIPSSVLREEYADLHGIEKAPTGITGLDEITYGGIAQGTAIASLRRGWLRQDLVFNDVPL